MVRVNKVYCVARGFEKDFCLSLLGFAFKMRSSTKNGESTFKSWFRNQVEGIFCENRIYYVKYLAKSEIKIINVEYNMTCGPVLQTQLSSLLQLSSWQKQ